MIELITLKENGDERGKLVVLEGMNQVPFMIARLFYIYNTTGDAVRGKHANRNSKFAFVCMKGHCRITTNDGCNEAVYTLTSPNQLLIMDEMVWKEMDNFSDDAVLLVLSNCVYDPHEYIYDFELFKKEVTA